VVLYDRHLADALATLELAYPDVDRRVHEAVVRRLLPRPDLTFYLDIDAATAAARKPGDTIGEWAINRQLERYAQTLTGTRHVITLDATAPHRDLVSTVLEALTQDRP